eukprot:m.53308 g.53308  ORF g.53308 m.53308 type:complete len:447 (-) comp10857_c0_seq1:174-1514(-)
MINFQRFYSPKQPKKMALQVFSLVVAAAFLVTHSVQAKSGIGKPPMGWMSWEHYGCNKDCDTFPDQCINEALYKRMADELVSQGFKDAGYEYINIDDCYLGPRTASGDLQADPARFPGGISAVADYMHSKGLKLGIYNDIGRTTCAGNPGLNVSATPDKQADERLAKDVAQMVSWGIDSLKVDGCAASKDVMNITYPKLGKLLNASGRHILYSCSWPVYLTLSECQGTLDCVPWQLLIESCDMWRLYKDIMDVFNIPGHAGISQIIDYWANYSTTLTKYNGPSSYHDPDQLLAGDNGLSAPQAEVQFGMWAMWSAPLLMSNDLTSLTDEYRAILLNKDVIAVNQDPLGKMATSKILGTVMLENAKVYLWTKPLSNGDVAASIVHLGDFDGQYFNASFTSSDIGLPTGSTFTAKNLFKGEELGTFHDQFQAYIWPSSILMLRISKTN